MGKSKEEKRDDNINPEHEQKPRMQHPLTASREELQSRSNALIPRKSAEEGAENMPANNSPSDSAPTGSPERGANSGTADTSKNSAKRRVINECRRPLTSPTGRSPIAPDDFAIYIASPSRSKSKKGKSKRGNSEINDVYVQAVETGDTDDMATLSSLGMGSKSIVWVVVKPVTGNNDREEIAALLRMSQSLSTLRHIIRSMPSVDVDYGKNTSPEYSEAELFVSKEKEHELMRQRMKMLKERRRKRNPNSVLLLEKTAKEEYEEDKTRSPSTKSPPVLPNKAVQSPSGEQKSTGVLSDTNVNLVDVSPVSPKLLTYDPVPITARELALFFDPPESLEELKIINDEMFDPPTNEQQLEKIREEVRNTRCGICRAKLPIAMREMRCCCDLVYCRRHRNPQDHRLANTHLS
ncbi:unnamed protein product [Toxocara canis]|uniref:AN1-type domain-containing protein n=1 Tax=Toxocara canis TaxID=6265 RepID=A0A183V2A0_TOXCA|nr:unnamed protein product [Toxocara canis]